MAARGKVVEVIRAQRGSARRLPLGQREIEEIRGPEEVAALQYGAVARWQLRLAGLSDDAIDRRIGRTLHPLFQSVFSVGATQPLTLPTAAVLASNGTLGFHTAAWLWGFGKEPYGVMDVVTNARRASRKGLRYHRSDAGDTRHRHGLPVTAPAHTVVDLATVLDPDETINLVDQALMTDHLSFEELEEAITPHRRGVSALRAAMDVDASESRSTVETHFYRLLKRARLPLPERNAIVAGHEFDFVWRRERLIVEYDSWRFHRSPQRFANDRVKQGAAQDAGFRVERMVRRQLFNETEALLVRIGRALAQTWPSTTPGTPVLVE